MDRLSISASVAGLTTLADVVVGRVCKYIRSCQNAAKDAKRLQKDVQTLLGILRGLDSLRLQIDNAQLSTHVFAEQIRHCEQTLGKIRAQLDTWDPAVAVSKFQKLKRTLEWSFTSMETNEILDDLGRYNRTFDLTISMDYLDMLLLKSTVHDETAVDVKLIKKDVVELSRIQLSKGRRRAQQFEATPALASTHRGNLRSRHPDTGNWSINSPDFQT